MITSEKSFQDYRQELHFSKSQLKTFLVCPRKYEFQYVKGLQWKTRPWSLPFGSAIHEAIAQYYRKFMQDGEPLGIEKVQSAFSDAWEIELKNDTPMDYNSKDPETLIDLGREMLRVFTETVQPRQIEAVELPFSVPIVDPKTGEISPVKLVGAFDLIEADEDGNRIITEHKTSSKKWTDGQVETELDSAIYSYAFKEMGCATNGSETLVKFDVLLKLKKPAMETYYTTRNEKDHRRMLSLISKVLKIVDNGTFHPVPGWQCPTCPFLRQCNEDI